MLFSHDPLSPRTANKVDDAKLQRDLPNRMVQSPDSILKTRRLQPATTLANLGFPLLFAKIKWNHDHIHWRQSDRPMFGKDHVTRLGTSSVVLASFCAPRSTPPSPFSVAKETMDLDAARMLTCSRISPNEAPALRLTTQVVPDNLKLCYENTTVSKGMQFITLFKTHIF